MTLLKRWRKRIRPLVRKSEVEGELNEELAFHLEMETQKHIRAGLDPAEVLRDLELGQVVSTARPQATRPCQRASGPQAGPWVPFAGQQVARIHPAPTNHGRSVPIRPRRAPRRCARPENADGQSGPKAPETKLGAAMIVYTTRGGVAAVR